MPTKIEWTIVPQAPKYEISRDGQLRNINTKYVLKHQITPSGHHFVKLLVNGNNLKLFIHRAVLFAFKRYPWDNEEGRHLDGNSHNNGLNNLDWGTRQENADDKKRHGTTPTGENAGSAKLTESQVIEIRQRYGTASLRQLAREYGVSHTAIRRAALGIKWSYLNG